MKDLQYLLPIIDGRKEQLKFRQKKRSPVEEVRYQAYLDEMAGEDKLRADAMEAEKNAKKS